MHISSSFNFGRMFLHTSKDVCKHLGKFRIYFIVVNTSLRYWNNSSFSFVDTMQRRLVAAPTGQQRKSLWTTQSRGYVDFYFFFQTMIRRYNSDP